MSIENVKDYLANYNRSSDIIELDLSSATVELAAADLNVEPARIAKTLAFRGRKDGESVLIVAAGDAKIENKKFKELFGVKARMLSAEETLEQTGHAVGGVCPFGLINDLPVYMDISLKRFATVFPACGSSNSAIELTCEELAEYGKGKEWVDVCKSWTDNS
ncbi:YbaK/EbsC family protein [Terribacillus saccharophilus]|uniref:YbaK/EbsC family protein n=1 Tax=Terribacillus saccharophilus TaxID=361277 RepID=UPI003981A287